MRSLLITGASSGIGLDAAHHFHARGWRVFATCRRAEDCARLRDAGLESFPLDLASEDSCAAAIETALERTGGTLDALFNNGAFASPGLVEDLPRGALRAIFETNVFGQFDLIRRVLPTMRAQGHGRIVLNSSVLGFVGLRARGAYVGTKFAMEGMTDVLRLEIRDEPIHVILVEPGPIASEIRQKARPHFERWIDWEASHQRGFYEKAVRRRLYADTRERDRFELPASAVSKKLEHALEHPRPHPRYFVTKPTYMMNLCRRILPTRLLDRILITA
ncbi:MAG: SDR family NAD(P)-dependent oxidoreductase [Pseudomonadota bacterium]